MILINRDQWRLTGKGSDLAEALIAAREAEKKVPDTCLLRISTRLVRVTFRGLLPQDDIGTNVRGAYFDGVCGCFDLNDAGKTDRVFVLFPHPDVSLDFLKGKPTSEQVALLMRRPGLRSVRDWLSGKIAEIREGIVPYPPLNPRGNAGTLEEFVKGNDDPRVVILADCERDCLEVLLERRRERQPDPARWDKIITWPRKRRFYSLEDVQFTLDDLSQKGLVRAVDDIHFDLNLSIIDKVVQVIRGTSSDELFGITLGSKVVEASQQGVEKQFDAFLCHASEDKEYAVVPFERAISEAGLKGWLDRAEVVWGDNLVRKVQQGLTKSRYVVAFLSAAFLGKGWPENELNTALSMEIGGGAVVLPVVLGLTHEELARNYPIVAAKLYIGVPEYRQGTPLQQADITRLVKELQRRMRADSE